MRCDCNGYVLYSYKEQPAAAQLFWCSSAHRRFKGQVIVDRVLTRWRWSYNKYFFTYVSSLNNLTLSSEAFVKGRRCERVLLVDARVLLVYTKVLHVDASKFSAVPAWNTFNNFESFKNYSANGISWYSSLRRDCGGVLGGGIKCFSKRGKVVSMQRENGHHFRTKEAFSERHRKWKGAAG